MFFSLNHSPASILNSGRRPSVLTTLLPGEVDIADAVARPFGDRDLQFDEPGLAVLRVLEDLQLRLPDLRAHVAALAVVLHDQVGVFFELAFLVRAAAQ